MAIAAALAATALFYRLSESWRRRPLFALGLPAALLIVFWGPFIGHFMSILRGAQDFPAGTCFSAVERAGCVALIPDQEPVVEFLRKNTQPADYLFVGNAKHDKIFINDILLYFLAGRRVPSRYTELHPGLATTLEVQRAIVQELQEKDVRWVVTADLWDSTESNASAVSSGVTLLDNHIRGNCREVAVAGLYKIWRR